jgi:hypothetical protein
MSKKTYIATKEEDERVSRAKLPDLVDCDPNDLVQVFISSRGTDAEQRKENGKTRKIVSGRIMGTRPKLNADGEPELDKDGKPVQETFGEDVEVECDKVVEIPGYIAQHFQAYIGK